MKFIFNTKVEGYNDLDSYRTLVFKGGAFIEKYKCKCALYLQINLVKALKPVSLGQIYWLISLK